MGSSVFLPSPHLVTFCPMTLRHVFLTLDLPLGHESLDQTGPGHGVLPHWRREQGIQGKQREGMNSTAEMIWDSDPSVSVGYEATQLLSLNLCLTLTSMSAIREYNLSSQVLVCGFFMDRCSPHPHGLCSGELSTLCDSSLLFHAWDPHPCPKEMLGPCSIMSPDAAMNTIETVKHRNAWKTGSSDFPGS